MNTQIEATGLGVTIDGRTVLANVSVAVAGGQMCALVGPSGSGKTTLLNCLGLLQRPDSGAVRVDGADSTRWPDRRRVKFWRDTVSFIYQDYGLIDEETLAYNVTLRAQGLFGGRGKTPPRLANVLGQVGLAGRGHEPVSVLSGGEKQRAGIARAMYKQARWIMADEPTASLDRENRQRVTSLLEQAAQHGAGVIIATHDESLAARCDLVYTLQAGQLDSRQAAAVNA